MVANLRKERPGPDRFGWESLTCFGERDRSVEMAAACRRESLIVRGGERGKIDRCNLSVGDETTLWLWGGRFSEAAALRCQILKLCEHSGR